MADRDYKTAASAYAALWKDGAGPAPDASAAVAAPAAAAALAPVTSMPLPDFQRMVGGAYVPMSALNFIKRVGAGSFATVEVADYTPTDGSPPRRVAVKRLRTGSQLSVADLAHEARVLKGLRHANIVGYVGVGAASGSPGAVIPDDQCYIVQEYVSGGTLKRAVASAADRRPGDPPTYTHADAAAWGADVARGLAYLHGANPVILHRDLKLENVLLTARTAPRAGPDCAAPPLPPGRGQTAQLADFGLAVSFVSPDIDARRSQLPPAEASGGASGSGGAGLGDRRASVVAEQMERADRGQKMTNRGVAAAASALETALSRHVYALTGKTGSYLYMAPCVTLCLPYNERADLFSLGCVLWELFSRRALATVVLGGARAGGATGADLARVAELYAHRVARGFRPPVPADWPPRVRALVAACWAGSPAERPTAAAVAAELESMLGDGTLAEWDARAGEEEDEGDWTGEGGCCVCF